jgi:two-component system sensor histidine kinase YesM
MLIIALATLIPFQITGIVLIDRGQTAIRNELTNAAMESTGSITSLLEQDVQYLARQLEALLAAPSLNDYVMRSQTMNNTEFYNTLNDHWELIRPLYLGNASLSDITIYYRDQDRMMSAASGYMPTTQQQYINQFEEIKASSGTIHNEGGKLYLSIMYPVTSVYSTAPPAYIIRFDLSTAYIHQLLSRLGGDRYTVLYDSEADRIINSNELGSQLSELFETEKQQFRNRQETTIRESRNAYTFAYYSRLMNLYIVQIEEKNELFSVTNQILVALILFTFLSIIAMLAYTYFSRKYVRKHVAALLEAFQTVEQGQLGNTLSTNTDTTEFNQLGEGFNRMSTKLKTAVTDLYEKEIYAQRMELKQLQAQINPHFLYNIYFLLHRLIQQEDFETANELSGYLGEYFQYITRNYQDKVSLEAEWNHAASYLEIQALRFSSTLEINIDQLTEEAKKIMVPRLILQPLLENAINYGIKGANEKAQVALKYTDDGSHCIRIENHGREITDQEFELIKSKLIFTSEIQAETTAITNIHRRLILEFGSSSGLDIQRLSDGLCVIIAIPKEVKK